MKIHIYYNKESDNDKLIFKNPKKTIKTLYNRNFNSTLLSILNQKNFYYSNINLIL